MSAPSSPLAQPSEKDLALLEAASVVFRRQGYVRASLREIAAAAGMRLGSLQYRYPTKDALFLALLGRELAEFKAMIATVHRRKPIPLTQLECLLTELTTQRAGPARTTLLLWLGIRDTLPPEAQHAMLGLKQEFDRALEALIASAIESGELRSDVTPEAFRVLLMAPLGWVLTYEAMETGHAELMKVFWQVLCQGIRSA